MLHDGFLASAARHPDAPALVARGCRLTYGQLERASAALGEDLHGRGARCVGVLATRSVAASVAYLAALRVGTVVPLQQTYPADRLRMIVAAAAVDVVVADAGQEVPDLGVPVVVVDDDDCRRLAAQRLRVGPLGAARSIAPAGERSLAYVMFTSGSTGRPKGVPVRHAMASAFARYVTASYPVGPGDRVSQTFHLGFDPSVFDMTLAWGRGAELVVPDDEDLFDPVGFVNRHRLTAWASVPALIDLADLDLSAGAMPSLRFSMFCGEPLRLDRAAAWARATPGAWVENAYGPTELTVLTTAHRLPVDLGDWPTTSNGTVPIGAPFAHLEAVVDSTSGELRVRGSQRFDGYLDAADDVGRFVDDAGTPQDTAGPESWYRTGDVVRDEGGTLVHHGRVDHQVKVLGQRIELMEVEHVMREWAGVRDVVVAALDASDGRTELAAVFTGQDRSAVELRTALLRRLPVAMVPQHYLRVSALPVNDRGKIDRGACAALLSAHDG